MPLRIFVSDRKKTEPAIILDLRVHSLIYIFTMIYVF